MHIVNNEDILTFNDIFTLGKKLLHGDKIDVSGADLDKFIAKGMRFNEKMIKLVESK